MTGQGGWPMTVVCTPDGRPFFAGTYFPKERRGGMIGFVELCERIDELWHTQRDDLLEQADQLTGALGRSALVVPRDGAAHRRATSTRRSTGSLAASRPGVGRPRRRAEVPAADGAGGAGRRGRPRRRAGARRRSPRTLDAMAAGGIYDHLGGGFARYAVDGVWLVPHFEKMLYDNALLIRLYLHGWQLTGEERLPPGARRDDRATCSATCASPAAALLGRGRRQRGRGGQVLRVDRHARCARSSASDADVARHWYGFRPGGNFEHGTTIPNRMHARGELARPPEVEAARQALFDARAHAGAPRSRRQGAHRVERLPRRRRWPRRARPPASPRGSTPRWRRPSSCSPTSGAPTAAGCARGRPTPAPGTSPTPPTTARSSTPSRAWPRPPARRAGSPRRAPAADALLDLFWDHEHGGVFTTGHDAEALIARPKDLMDNATPGANGLAAVGLLRLAALTGDERYREHGEAIVRLLGAMAVRAPDRLRARAGRRRPRRPRHHRDRRRRRPPRPARRRARAASCPTPCSPGASATTARSGRAGTTAGPTSASATPASSRRPTSRRWPRSSPS